MSDIIDDLLATYGRDVKDPSNGKIYRIVCDDSDDVYIGSTCQTLDERFSQHLKVFMRWKYKKTFRYISSMEIFKQGKARIELVEDYSCQTMGELHMREGEIILSTPNTVNKTVPCGKWLRREQRRKEQEATHQMLEEVKIAQDTFLLPTRGLEMETSISDMMKDLQAFDCF
jgi:hypothetical protein